MAASHQTWTIQRILEWTRGYFEEQGIESARLDAELLLGEVLGQSRVFLYTHYDQPLTAEERNGFRALVKRRAAREPVAYLLGCREFFSRSFAVSPAVMVPRPETEHLVEAALAFVERRALTSPRILDLGTGSGCIAITLACELPGAQIVATDILPAALEVAGQNAAAHAVGARIELLKGDLFGPVASRDPFDIIVSNPPYVEKRERMTLQPEVRDFEPPVALFGGDDGLDVIRQIIPGLSEHLAKNGCFVCEHGDQQHRAVRDLLDEVGGFGSVETIRDLARRERGVIAQR